MMDVKRPRKNPTGHIAPKKDKKEATESGAFKRFVSKFRAVVSHNTPSRPEKSGRATTHPNGRHKAKAKARNRRNRKLARALHQRERRRS